MEEESRVKAHFKKYKWAYISAGIAIGSAGITYLIVRGNSQPRISSGMTGTASSGMTGTGENVVSIFNPTTNIAGNDNTITLQQIIKSNRQGAPSWVVRCLETGEIYSSQRAAAHAMEIPESIISKFFNGLIEDAHGYTFERICMAA